MTVPSSLLVHERVALDRITLVYRTASGEELTQRLGDITDVGTLIDPDTGDDLELTSVLVRLSDPDKPQAFIVPAHFRDALGSALQQLRDDADDNTQRREHIAALQEKLDHAFPVNFTPAAKISTDQPAVQSSLIPALSAALTKRGDLVSLYVAKQLWRLETEGVVQPLIDDLLDRLTELAVDDNDD